MQFKDIGIKMFQFFPAHYHLYAYGKNNPISQMDAYGLISHGCPPGYRREVDFDGFIMCTTLDQYTVVLCGACAVLAIKGVTAPAALLVCTGCLVRVLHCASINYKCVC